MFKISTLVALTLFIVGCHPITQRKSVTVKAFTKKYLDALSNKFPAASFTMANDSTIEGKYNGISTCISADNAFMEYQQEPDSLQKVLNKYLGVSGELFSKREKINIDRIVPIIKPTAYLTQVKLMAAKMGAKKDAEGVYEKYNDELLITYAEDTENSIRYLTHDDINSLSLNADSLRSMAVKNLSNLLTNIEMHGDGSLYMLTAGGDYETSLILLDYIFTKENLPVDGDFIIAIPNRDLLLITGSNNKAGIKKIKEIATKAFLTGSYQVSEYLYKWNGHKFEKFQ